MRLFSRLLTAERAMCVLFMSTGLSVAHASVQGAEGPKHLTYAETMTIIEDATTTCARPEG